MAKIIQTSTLDLKKQSTVENHNIYCGLDSCLTIEIFESIEPNLDRFTASAYSFSRALQGPVLHMMTTGILTDKVEVSRMFGVYSRRLDAAKIVLNKLAEAIWDQPLNHNSPTQVKAFFYDHMQVPCIYNYVKGEKKLSVDRKALEAVQAYRYPRPVASAVLSCRDLSKKLGVLRSGIDDDERMRFSYNIGGTNSGRFSCNSNVFGGGTNANNITDGLRIIFIARDDYKLAYIDLEQAESRGVAYLSGDQNYIDACESSDLHVFVAKLIWPELDWSPNGDSSVDRAVADQKYYRHFSYRDLSKRGGHLTNYLGQAISNAKNLGISLDIMKSFQTLYLGRFSGISRWHSDTSRILQTTKEIITPMGRKRLFFGRGDDAANLRAAVAFNPQSMIGDILNIGMWRIWRHMPEVTLLTQLYDAVLIEYEDRGKAYEHEIISRAIDHMTMSIPVTETKLKDPKTRNMIIPVDATVGWNWAKGGKENPDGLTAFDAINGDKRSRQVEADGDILKRIIS